jgi:hypothetical protein
MELLIGNHLGLWALLGIPAVLLIHFIQQKSRKMKCSTLFLLESLVPESADGRRFEWIRNSSSLWWQILAVLLITWALSQPRWIRRDSVQRVVILLDSSISMSAFKDELTEKLVPRLREMGRSAARTEWLLSQTDLSRFEIYTGGDLNVLIERLSSWEPDLGSHDFQPAFDLTRKLAGLHGNIVLVSDRKVETPPNISLIAVGHTLDNCGLIGPRIYLDQKTKRWVFEALIRNYAASPQKRSWWIESENGKSAENEADLTAGGMAAIKGTFPADTDTLHVRLTPDQFSIDDSLPLVIPRNKQLKFYIEPGLPVAPFVRHLLLSFDDIERSSSPEGADLRFVPSADGKTPPSGTLIALHASSAESAKRTVEPLIAERNPFIDDLHWEGLIAAAGSPAAGQDFQPLLWQGDRALIFERALQDGRALLINFDLRISNADRLPAFVILLHRFIEQVRSDLPRYERKNLEAGQLLGLAQDLPPGDLTLRFESDGRAVSEQTLSPSQAQVLQAPARPGLIHISQAGRSMYDAAVSFADPRESDFSSAASADLTGDLLAAVREGNTTSDFYLPFWLVLLGVVILVNWLSQIQPARKPSGARK